MQQQKMDGADTEKEYVDELKPGTQLLQGQYTIDRFLNSGGFGITYLAKDSLDRRIVIKECFPGSFCRRSQAIVAARSRAHQNEFRSVVKLFMQEARSLAKLVHPNIVGVHQVFEDNSTAYMAIDYVDGRDLLELIEDPAVSFKPEEIVDMTKKLLSAITFIHDNDVLHRDISPDNILMGKDGEPILIDFGAAREQATKASRALSALRVVKDGYSPQEFYVAGSSQGPWSDLYALAASLYHLIKDEAPINSQVRLAAVAEGRGDPYVPLAGAIKGYPEGFLEAIDKAMQTVPAQRLQSAQEWLDMFQNPGAADKVVPLKVEKTDASKAVPPKTQAGAKQESNTAGDKAALTEEAAAAGGGNKKMILMGSAAAVAVVAGIGIFALSGGSDETETVAQPPVLSTPAAKPVETASTSAAKPVTTAPKPAATPTTASSRPVTTAPTRPAATTTSTRPTTTTASTSSSTTSRTTTNRSGGTSFADIIGASPSGTSTRPTTIAPRSSTTTTARPTTTARATTTTTRPTTTAPRTTTTTRTTTTPSTTTRSSTGGQNSFTNFLSTQSRPQTPSRTTTSRSSTTTTTAARPATTQTSQPQDSNALFANIVGNGSTGIAPSAIGSTQGKPAALTGQVNAAGWSVDLPFEVTVTRRQGASVALITSITNAAAARAAGSWVAEGVEIHEVNGQEVKGGVTIASMILNGQNVNSSGNIRTAVKIKKVGAQSTTQDTLNLGAIRRISLNNGVEVETSRVAGKWTTKVTKAAPSSNGLRVGDVLLNERTTSTALTSARSVEQIMGDLITNGVRIAQFDVQRGSGRAVANMTLK